MLQHMIVNDYYNIFPACSLFVDDDHVWEGPETLRVELELDPNQSLGAEIPADGSSTVVVIDDSEDSKPAHAHTHNMSYNLGKRGPF